MPFFMLLRIHSMLWNTEFVDQSQEETVNWIHSLRLMFSFQDNKFNLIHLLRKFRKQSTKLQQLFLDVAKHCTTGINKTLKMIKNNLFMKWSHKTNKLSKSSFFWQVRFKEQRTKSTTSFLNSINSNGFGKSRFQNLSKISLKVQKNPNYQLMRPNSRSSLRLKRILIRSSWHL